MSNPSQPNANGGPLPSDLGTQLALIQQSINYIRMDIAAMRSERAQDERELKEYRDATEGRLRFVESQVGKLSERMTIWQGLQAGLTLAVGALAAYLGATLR